MKDYVFEYTASLTDCFVCKLNFREEFLVAYFLRDGCIVCDRDIRVYAWFIIIDGNVKFACNIN